MCAHGSGKKIIPKVKCIPEFNQCRGKQAGSLLLWMIETSLVRSTLFNPENQLQQFPTNSTESKMGLLHETIFFFSTLYACSRN